MKIFSVNREFGVCLPNCTFYVDDIHILNNVGLRSHVSEIEYSYSEFNGNPSGKSKLDIEKHTGYFKTNPIPTGLVMSKI